MFPPKFSQPYQHDKVRDSIIGLHAYGLCTLFSHANLAIV